MVFKLNLYFKEVLLFGSALFLGIFSAKRLFQTKIILPGSTRFELADLIILLVFAILILVLRKKKMFITITFRLFLILIILGGAQIIFGSFLRSPFDIAFSLGLLILYLFYRNVLIHNIAIILGIAGIGTVVGLSITPKFGVALLVILSFYDIIAVYKTKHMVSMAKNMIQSGAIFGFVIPSKFKNFVASSSEAKEKMGGDFMILGSGDIGLPLIMVCSLVPISLNAAIVTGSFSLIGLFFTHLIFINQKQRKPMAALPPIATLTVIGYLITLI